MISFALNGPPITTNQAYKLIQTRYGQPRLKLSDEAAWWKLRLAKAARAAHRLAGSPAAIEHGAVLAVRFVFPTLGTDVDGPVKLVQDAVASGTRGHPGAGLVVNDNRICELHAFKGDCDGHPRTEVAIALAGELACPRCGCSCRSLLP